MSELQSTSIFETSFLFINKPQTLLFDWLLFIQQSFRYLLSKYWLRPRSNAFREHIRFHYWSKLKWLVRLPWCCAIQRSVFDKLVVIIRTNILPFLSHISKIKLQNEPLKYSECMHNTVLNNLTYFITHLRWTSIINKML